MLIITGANAYVVRIPLTQSAAIQLHSHWNPPVPGNGMNTNVSSFDGGTEPMLYYKVTFDVCLEYLNDKENTNQLTEIYSFSWNFILRNSSKHRPLNYCK